MNIEVAENLTRRDRKRVKKLTREMWDLSHAESLEEWRAFSLLNRQWRTRCDLIETELIALISGDVDRAHEIQNRRARSKQALNAFCDEVNIKPGRSH
jgi:NADH:ubiquinone oxidoreductase subunit B-like Fe-S oxidoreductase